MLNATAQELCGYTVTDLASNNSYRQLRPQAPYRKYISFRKLAK